MHGIIENDFLNPQPSGAQKNPSKTHDVDY